ncbi:MAG: cytochrome C biogenesis protein ResB [Deltaproteobacteria bacterium]|nr:MAG: cytochrome C biogenesis protein ResB [Deltaproteobacteria bacterium]
MGMSGKNRNKLGGRMLWQLLASVKLSVLVLSLLALTSILGTVIPQNTPAMLLEQKVGSAGVAVLTFFDLTDMYHSWWFRFLLVLLAVNLVVCSVERLQGQRKILFGSRGSLRPERFKNVRQWGAFSVNGRPAEVAAVLSGGLGRAAVTAAGDEVSQTLVWETGRWTRFGVYGVHASILLLLAGGMVGSLTGFEGRMRVPEGGQEDTVELNRGGSLPLDFSIRCDAFSMKLHASGLPDEYRSTLTLLEGDREILTRDILVNNPLMYKGIRIFQSSYEIMPAGKVTLGITGRSDGLTRPVEAAIGDTIPLSDGQTLTLLSFISGFQLRGHPLGDALICRIQSPDGDPREVALPVQFPGFDKMRGGNEVLSLLDYDKQYVTGLQVTRDPGVPIVYSGFLLLFIGCWVTFFMGHQRFCIEITCQDAGTQVRVLGLTDRNPLGFRQLMTRLTCRLAKRAGASEPDVSRLSLT